RRYITWGTSTQSNSNSQSLPLLTSPSGFPTSFHPMDPTLPPSLNLHLKLDIFATLTHQLGLYCLPGTRKQQVTRLAFLEMHGIALSAEINPENHWTKFKLQGGVERVNHACPVCPLCFYVSARRYYPDIIKNHPIHPPRFQDSNINNGGLLYAPLSCSTFPARAAVAMGPPIVRCDGQAATFKQSLTAPAPHPEPAQSPFLANPPGLLRPYACVNAWYSGGGGAHLLRDPVLRAPGCRDDSRTPTAPPAPPPLRTGPVRQSEARWRIRLPGHVDGVWFRTSCTGSSAALPYIRWLQHAAWPVKRRAAPVWLQCMYRAVQRMIAVAPAAVLSVPSRVDTPSLPIIPVVCPCTTGPGPTGAETALPLLFRSKRVLSAAGANFA
ncbi:hypothetical protein B0H16DRAFT_1811086, partial [Mycena metata]